MSATLLNVISITKRFTSRRGTRCVLDNVCFQISPGERVAFVGPNGSGKTTLLRILLGIEPQDSGKVIWNCPQKENPITYVPQDYRHALFPWFTLRTNLAMAHVEYQKQNLLSSLDAPWMRDLEQRYRELEREYRLSLDLNKKPYEISGGEQQIFLLIRSLLMGSAVLVLDEPLSAVDYGRKQRIHESLNRIICERNLTVLFSSHDFEEAVKLSDRVIVFTSDSGQIKTTVPVDLPWPRTNAMKTASEFSSAVEKITHAIL